MRLYSFDNMPPEIKQTAMDVMQIRAMHVIGRQYTPDASSQIHQLDNAKRIVRGQILGNIGDIIKFEAIGENEECRVEGKIFLPYVKDLKVAELEDTMESIRESLDCSRRDNKLLMYELGQIKSRTFWQKLKEIFK